MGFIVRSMDAQENQFCLTPLPPDNLHDVHPSHHRWLLGREASPFTSWHPHPGRTPAAQVRVFSARDHTRALLAKDAWAAVGWSGDLVPLAERAGDLTLVAPRSGAPLWADLWAVPAGARNGSGVRRRLGFLLGIWILKRCPVVAAERAGDLTFVAPRSGAPLWADLWAVPAGARNGSGVRPHPWGFCSD